MWQCDWKHSQYNCHNKSFLFGLKIRTNVKNKHEKGTFDHLYILRKKSLDFQKIEKSCCDIF
jgi:hypothetical protein